MATTTDVEYNFLGKTGVKVSNICLGTMTFGKQEGGPFNVRFNINMNTLLMFFVFYQKLFI
jgi:hypothetical protein